MQEEVVGPHGEVQGGAPSAVLELDTIADVAASFRPCPRSAEDWDEAYGPTAFRVRGRLLDSVTGT